MTEPPPHSDTGTPRWVKFGGLIALLVVVLIVVMLVIGGDHGPSRHSALAGVSHYSPD